MPIDRMAWAMGVASRFVPRATCLAQGLAAQLLLSRQGYRARLYIGVAKDENERLEAHAWLEAQGRIVVGGKSVDLSRFAPLPPLDIGKS